MNSRANDILSKLNPTFKIQDWCQNKVLRLDEVPYIDFYTQRKSEPVKISPNLITGTNHDRYNKGTWIEMLEELKERGSSWANVTKDLVLKIIDQGNLKNDYVCIWQYGNDYIIMFGGNHRIFYAKFLELEYIEVMLTTYELNADFAIFKNLESFNFQPRRYKGIGNWGLDIVIGASTVTLRNYDLAQYLLRFSDDLPSNHSLTQGLKLKLLGGNIEKQFEKAIYIKSISEIEKLKPLLINHKIKNSTEQAMHQKMSKFAY